MTPSCPTKHSVLPPPEHIHGGPTAFMACLRHQGTTVDETGAQRSPTLKQAEAERQRECTQSPMVMRFLEKIRKLRE